MSRAPQPFCARGPVADRGTLSDHDPVSAAEFSALMGRLGPWPVDRRVAVAVSGGPDSLALALLTKEWARGRAKPMAFVVDHGIRAESGGEARWAADQLRRFGIPAQLLRLEGLASGPGLQERARNRRYEALREACRRAGLLDLLLGHQSEDQEETMIMRARAGSGPDGRAGMAPVSERSTIRLVRPLLAIPPARLRATLRAASLGWIDDPTNRDRRYARTRLREEHARAGRDLVATEDSGRAGATRARRAREVAAFIAAHVPITEEGVAFLPEGTLPAPVLARLVQALSGRDYPASTRSIERLAAAPRAATLSGVVIQPGGRFDCGFLLFRELDAMAPPVAARLGAVWDGRFRLRGAAEPPHGWRLGGLGAREAAKLRRRSALPAAALATLPALFDAEGRLRAVPHLRLFSDATPGEFEVIFSPRVPVAPSFFTPSGEAGG